MLITGNQTAATGKQKFPEKRGAARIPVAADIVFMRFITKTDAKFRAKIFDYSPEGMAFESNCPFGRGDGLFIRIEERAYAGAAGRLWHSPQGECLRTTTLAEVRWCRQMPGASESSYRVGVKYTSPVIS